MHVFMRVFIALVVILVVHYHRHSDSGNATTYARVFNVVIGVLYRAYQTMARSVHHCFDVRMFARVYVRFPLALLQAR